ncbi:heme-binding protein [Flavobacterium sp.]|uniref:heme-binding protein n=1 Tax=Flavobacterium sp. TaxID=239 RepID=UPI0022BB172E|nr:heme-binding protein [Flavobacterium sp.]MCZ8090659.1 heme-binding protein [Flavobacterium sp.]
MKTLHLILLLLPFFGIAQTKDKPKELALPNNYIQSVDNLTLSASFEIVKRVNESAHSLNKKVAIAILDASGTIVLLTRDDGVGPHNADAAKRKAFTALSTKTPTLLLLRNAQANDDTKNLNTLPELLLLSGGSPIWYKGTIVGSIGVAGGGSPDNDDFLAKSATIQEFGITTSK